MQDAAIFSELFLSLSGLLFQGIKFYYNALIKFTRNHCYPRDHSFSPYVKFSEKLAFLTP